MSQRALPFLMFNYGCEMLFILRIRLEAHMIESLKADRILSDIVNSIFGCAKLEMMFSHKGLYSDMQTRKIFTAASDSSVMKLNEMSMRKLYDLISMTVKYQLLTLRHPWELVELTLNHLEELTRVAPAAVHATIDDARSRFVHLASSLSRGQLAAIRRDLLNFCADRHVKVSLFLEQNSQRANGTFFLPPDRFLSPDPNVEAPGPIRYYQNHTVAAVEHFLHRDGALKLPPHIPLGTWSAVGPADRRMTRNGANLYESNPTVTSSKAAKGTAPAAPISISLAHTQAYQNDSNRLAQLIGTGLPAADDRITLNWLDEDDLMVSTPVNAVAPVVAPATSAAPRLQPSPSPVHVTRMDSVAVRLQNEQLLGIISGFDTTGSAAAPVRDSLLDIMDEV